MPTSEKLTVTPHRFWVLEIDGICCNEMKVSDEERATTV